MATQSPNVVLVVIDDLGWRDAGCLGSDFYETPNVDRLAASGIQCTNAYATGPNCAPSRASLMTGMYPPRHKIYTVGDPDRGEAHRRKLVPSENRIALDPEITTIADVLRTAGYDTGFVGKWHLGKAGTESGPCGHGFDHNVGGTQTGSPPAGYFPPYDLPNLPDDEDGYLTDQLTNAAVDFIEADRDRPFFCCLCHYAVHTPIQAKAEMADKYVDKEPDGRHHIPAYAAMIESVDESVGRLLDTLDAMDEREDTLIIFTADHGGHGGYAERGHPRTGTVANEITGQSPLRGGKGTFYEGGIRVPFLAAWPDQLDARQRCNEPISGIDVLPTIIEAVDDARLPADPVDGTSLLDLFVNKTELPRDTLHWHFPAYLQGNAGTWRTTPGGIIRSGAWKLIEYYEDDRTELYNLSTDIGEQVDLSADHPERVGEMQELQARWRQRLGAEIPETANPGYDPART